MRVQIEINCDNAAFEDRTATEICRILKRIVKRVEDSGESEFNLRDINGNKVGTYRVTD